MKTEKIIEELELICSCDEYTSECVQKLHFSYEPYATYLHHLFHRVKPETAANDLLSGLFDLIFNESINREVNYGRAFVDFVFEKKNAGNAVCVELKALYYLNTNKNVVYKKKLDYQAHKKQIVKYLSKQGIEYVILTNMETAWIFNRDAFVEFKPFIELPLVQVFRDFLSNPNLWDVIRRYDDNIKITDLDAKFFGDLKKWFATFENIKLVEHEQLSREEIIVLFLNKFIFVKTLEDYGLIKYRFIHNAYETQVDLGEPKGNYQIFKHFFDIIEEFFEIYYDTELFTSNFFDFLIKDKDNLRRFRKVFETILGLNPLSIIQGQGLLHYNYRQIDEDIFGKAYETWIAEDKKDEGIYYTPSMITDYMAKKIVNQLFAEPIELLQQELIKPAPDYKYVDQLLDSLYSIKIIDSTSGSGSFLIKVVKAIFSEYRKLKDSMSWAVNFQSKDLFSMPDHIKKIGDYYNKMLFGNGNELKLISSILLRHIYAADKDERALDTAKVNIWKEAVKLNPRIYNYRMLDESKQHILPNLELNFIPGDSLSDIDFDRQTEIMASEFQEEIKRLFQIRNKYIANPYENKLVQDALAIKRRIRSRILEEDEARPDALYYPVEFFFCFFAPDGSPLPAEVRGFDGIISNPPWEAIKPVKKEFAKLGKYGKDVIDFNKWFTGKLKRDTNFSEKWDEYTAYYKEYNKYLYSKYKRQSSGDPNLYKFFMERDFQLIHDRAFYCLLIPSGFQTDEGSNLLRKLLIEDYKLLELKSFENRGYYIPEEKAKVKLFPDVDNRFKFSIVYASKQESTDHSFQAKFYMHHPEELESKEVIEYDVDKIQQFSPDNWSIMEFRTDRDYETCLKIKGKHKLLKDTNIVFRREFDMTNDNKLFHRAKDVKEDKRYLPLYEGKMIHQFNSTYEDRSARYYISENEAREILMRKTKYRIKKDNNIENGDFDKLDIPEDLNLDYQNYRLAYRAIGRSTDERTIICTILPQKVFLGHSMNHLVVNNYQTENGKIIIKRHNYSDQLLTMALLNSLVLNYYIRNKVSANLTMNFMYELPIPEANSDQIKHICELGYSLLKRRSGGKDFDELGRELGVEADMKTDLLKLRAKLEILIARGLYGLNKDDWDYLTSTFTFGSKSQTKAELDEIIRLSRELWV